ncbi:LuxR C-terminal-related transcriptional regulator [Kitasatospora sp. NPDC048407]|uniref:LuxR C-terminal-related transcriptional regulator n=1 Tax=Kitasatospora sp. NPDC048407 TaxID=3364051 RepID=UPI00371C4396
MPALTRGSTRTLRPPTRRGTRSLDALHTEIDNPLDLLAGHQLLTDAAPTCACGHPLCPSGGAHRPAATRIFLIERHPVVSAGLRSLLAPDPELAVIGTATDAAHAVAAVHRARPDLILLGRGPGLDADLAAVAALRRPEGAPDARVLLLRRAATTTEASRILMAGGSGCFPLDLPPDRIIDAVHLAAAGATLFLPAPTPLRPHPAPAERPLDQAGLTDRERQVLTQLALGLSNAEIARRLTLAEATVKKHLTHAMRKTGQSDRLRAALYAVRHGLTG